MSTIAKPYSARSALTVTSQFSFCGVPFRLDSYKGCSFDCSYCYARRRPADAEPRRVIPAEPDLLERAFRHAETRSPTIVSQFLRRRVPVHFGGMSDPLQQAESRWRITQAFMKALAHRQYPTVFSTRSPLLGLDPYISFARENAHFIAQFSMSTTRDRLAAKIEPNAPRPTDILKTMAKLSSQGVITACRWQPYIPDYSECADEYIQRVSEAGARHLAVEHLKLPLDRFGSLPDVIVRVSGSESSLLSSPTRQRNGLEVAYTPESKLEFLREAKRLCHRHGLTFGCADNELQYISDTSCCCTGADQFQGFDNWFKHQIGYAVRKSLMKKTITYGEISREWLPTGSIDRYLSSNNRMRKRNGSVGSIRDHIKARWNDPKFPQSPSSFYGVAPTEEFTRSGYRIYKWKDNNDVWDLTTHANCRPSMIS